MDPVLAHAGKVAPLEALESPDSCVEIAVQLGDPADPLGNFSYVGFISLAEGREGVRTVLSGALGVLLTSRCSASASAVCCAYPPDHRTRAAAMERVTVSRNDKLMGSFAVRPDRRRRGDGAEDRH